MASFTKRGNTWQYTVSRMINGKSVPLRKGGFTKKKAAQVAAAELSKGIVINNKPIPFEKYFEDWFKLYKRNVTKSTLEHYKYTLQAIRVYFDDKHLSKTLKDAIIKSFLIYMVLQELEKQ